MLEVEVKFLLLITKRSNIVGQLPVVKSGHFFLSQ